MGGCPLFLAWMRLSLEALEQCTKADFYLTAKIILSDRPFACPRRYKLLVEKDVVAAPKPEGKLTVTGVAPGGLYGDVGAEAAMATPALSGCVET